MISQSLQGRSADIALMHWAVCMYIRIQFHHIALLHHYDTFVNAVRKMIGQLGPAYAEIHPEAIVVHMYLEMLN